MAENTPESLSPFGGPKGRTLESQTNKKKTKQETKETKGERGRRKMISLLCLPTNTVGQIHHEIAFSQTNALFICK